MTVKEIADITGVSIGTVDRVLHKRGRVSPETQSRVEAVIAANAYTPNPLARHLKRKKDYVLKLLAPRRDEDSGYWEQAFTGIDEARRSLSAFGVIIELEEFDRYSRSSFESAAGRAADRADGILMSPIMPEASRAFIAAIEGRVPYAFFDAALPGAKPIVSIGQDPFSAGYLAGRLARLIAAADGTFVALSSHGEDFHIDRRKSGFAAYFRSEAPVSEIRLENDAGLEDPAEAIRCAESAARRFRDLRGIFVANSVAHRLGVALKELELKRQVAVVGFDLVPRNIDQLRQGGIDVIISQRPQFQVKAGLEALHRHVVLGEAIADTVSVPFDIFFKENIPVGQDR